MSESSAIENAKIEKIGLFYDGHHRKAYVRAELFGRGWGSSVQIPVDKAGKLCEMLHSELDSNIEDGVYIEDLAGAPVRVLLNGASVVNSSIVGIGDLLCSEDEMLMLRD